MFLYIRLISKTTGSKKANLKHLGIAGKAVMRVVNSLMLDAQRLCRTVNPFLSNVTF